MGFVQVTRMKSSVAAFSWRMVVLEKYCHHIEACFLFCGNLKLLQDIHIFDLKRYRALTFYMPAIC